MKYELVLKREAVKYLAGLDKPTKMRIKKALELITQDPPEGAIASMKGIYGCFRLRVGSFRIIIKVDEDKHLIYALAIGPRGDI